MTSKVSDIIKRALLVVGAQNPRETLSGSDAETCLNELRDLIPALPGWSGWTEVTVDGDWAPQGEDLRITVTGEAEVDITLPPLVWDALEIEVDGNGMPVTRGEVLRPPRDGARIAVCAQATGQQSFFAYRGDSGQWLKVAELGLTDDAPVSGDMHGHLVALLAERLAPIYGLPLSGEAARAASRARVACMARYRRQDAGAPVGESDRVGSYM